MIINQETGKDLFEEFRDRIAFPLQMEDFVMEEDTYYHYELQYSIHPAYPFKMSARDMARIGYLYLRNGKWKNQQIIPSKWIKETAYPYSIANSLYGYGYMWWTGTRGGLFPNVHVKEHSYYASGWGGQKVIVLPYRDLVIVHRVNTDKDGQAVDTSQIGTLLWLILDAAGETEIGGAPFIEDAPGVRLTAEDLQETLAGSTLRSATNSGELVIAAREDVTLTVSVGEALIDAGKWWTEGDTLCALLTSSNPEGSCSLVILDGSTIKLYDLDGVLEEKWAYSKE